MKNRGIAKRDVISEKVSLKILTVGKIKIYKSSA